MFGNNLDNYQLRRFTMRENIAKKFFGEEGVVFLTHTVVSHQRTRGTR